MSGALPSRERTPLGHRSSSPGPGVLDLPIAEGSLHVLREQVAAHARTFGMGPGRVATLKVIASELVSNVIRHGGGTGRVILWRHGSEIYCQVHDHGPGITDPTIGSTAPDLTASHGRGLWMCRQLTTDLIITGGEGDAGTTVTAVRPVEATPDADGRSRASHRSAPTGTVRSGSGRTRDARQDHHTDQGSHHRRSGRG